MGSVSDERASMTGRSSGLLGFPMRLVRAYRLIGPSLFLRTVIQRLRQLFLALPLPRIPWRRSEVALGGRALARAIERGEFREAMILSAKFDAFGGRLWNLLNAVRVAEALGAQMRFYWPLRPLDGIRPAEEVFDPSFLHDHAVETVHLPSLRNVRTWTGADLAHLQGSSEMVWYEAKHRDPAFDKFDIATRGFRFTRLPSYRDAFELVRFHPSLERVRGRVAELGRLSVGVHARRGDLYEGDFRLGGHAIRKAIPLPVIDLLLQQRTGDDPAVLISNDAARIRGRLRTDPRRVLIASEVIDEVDTELEAMFLDFCLFARCAEVFAGTSVFAILPTQVGGGRLLQPHEVIREDTLRSAVMRFVEQEAGHPDLEVALACSFLLDRFGTELSESENDRLLEIAVHADPENPGLVLAQAARHLRRGRADLADDLFRRTMAAGAPEYGIRLTEQSLDLSRGVGLTAVDGGFLEPRDWQTIEDAASEHAWPAFYLGLRRLALGDHAGAATLIEAFLPAAAGSIVAAAEDLLARSEGLSPAASGAGLSTSPGPAEGF